MKLKFCLVFLMLSCLAQSQVLKCGDKKIRQRIFGGTKGYHGEFPWIVALLKRIDGEFKYFCGGVIISEKFVLTAAHCIHQKYHIQAFQASKIKIVLGGYDLKLSNEFGREEKIPVKVHVHADWQPLVKRYDADIALLELDEELNFTNYIQPICLWDSIIQPGATIGQAVGYGKSEDITKSHENIPKKIDIPFQSQEDCFLKEPELAKLGSNRTFCAGSADGTGVCVGDSGGGLFFHSNAVYYLKGIVSSSLIVDGMCDVDNYAIFTNVLKYTDWIKSFGNEIAFSHQVSVERIDINRFSNRFSENVAPVQSGHFIEYSLRPTFNYPPSQSSFTTHHPFYYTTKTSTTEAPLDSNKIVNDINNFSNAVRDLYLYLKNNRK